MISMRKTSHIASRPSPHPAIRNPHSAFPLSPLALRKGIPFAICILTFALALAGPAWAEDQAAPGQIAFLRLTDGFWQLWVMKADGSTHRQLTQSPVDKVHAAWGPGNRHILYHTNQGETLILDLETGKERRILKDLAVTDAAWSPDGKRLAYGLPPEDPVKGKTALWVSSLDGGDRRKLAGGSGSDALAPGWIPVGAPLAAPRGVGRVTAPAKSAAPILYRQCLTTSHMEVRHDFWVTQVDVGATHASPHGNTPVPLKGDNETHKFDQAVSSQGIVAYSSIRSGYYEIWTIPLQGGKPRQITKLQAYAGNPIWSPDGKKLAFDSDSGKNGVVQIYVVGASGQGLTRLTKGKAPSRKPVWNR